MISSYSTSQVQHESSSTEKIAFQSKYFFSSCRIFNCSFPNFIFFLFSSFSDQMNQFDYERYVFRLIKQEVGETFNSFIIRLRNQIHKCGFYDPETHFKDQILEKCSINGLRRKAFEDGMSLDHVIFTGRILEMAEINCTEIKVKQEDLQPCRSNNQRSPCRSFQRSQDESFRRSPSYDQKFSRSFPNRSRSRSLHYDRQRRRSLSPRRSTSRRRSKSPRKIIKLLCTRCGTSGHNRHSSLCPSTGYQCKTCFKRGHFEEMCFSTKIKVERSRSRERHRSRYERKQSTPPRRRRSASREKSPIETRDKLRKLSTPQARTDWPQPSTSCSSTQNHLKESHSVHSKSVKDRLGVKMSETPDDPSRPRRSHSAETVVNNDNYLSDEDSKIPQRSDNKRQAFSSSTF